MNHRRGLQRVYTLVALAWASFAVFAVLSFAQTPAKKNPPAHARPDNWQKSKECAAQAEKVMTEKPGSWENHYSPKYDRCFISKIQSAPGKGAGKDYPEVVNQLVDAFERTTLAQWVSDYPHSEGPLNGVSCHIDYQPVGCANVARFIAEHMRK